MTHASSGTSAYYCPMHASVRRPVPGNCPECGMALLPEGARFGLLRHVFSNPMHVAVMAGLMIAIMAVAMMW
jgi:heavy metal-binding protein